jgi:hypothetical protein
MSSNLYGLQFRENYIILREYIKYVLPPLIKVVVPLIKFMVRLITSVKKKEYAFNVLPEYDIIFRNVVKNWSKYKI